MIAVYIFLVLVALSILKALFRSIRRISLPPGPKGLPLVGNILDMPVEREWLTFARWGEVWGPLSFQSTLSIYICPSQYINFRRHMFDHCIRSTHYHHQFGWSCMRHAGQEKCDLFRSTSASNGRRTRWLETYIGSFALRRSFPSLPAFILQAYRKPGGREAFFSERRTRNSALPASSPLETQRLGCACTKVSSLPTI